MYSRAPDPVSALWTLAGRGALQGSRLVRVLCVDDQAYFRRVLSRLVAGTPGFIQVGEASSGEEAITAAADLRPDLVLMDVRMPGIDGCQATATLLEDPWHPFIVLMSADPLEPPGDLAARAGEVVFVSKGELSPHRLLDLWRARRTS